MRDSSRARRAAARSEVELLDPAEEPEQPLGGRADQAGRQRHLARGGFGLPLHLDRGHGLGDALELELADRREARACCGGRPSPGASSVVRICPPSALSQRRAASTTQSP